MKLTHFSNEIGTFFKWNWHFFQMKLGTFFKLNSHLFQMKLIPLLNEIDTPVKWNWLPFQMKLISFSNEIIAISNEIGTLFKWNYFFQMKLTTFSNEIDIIFKWNCLYFKKIEQIFHNQGNRTNISQGRAVGFEKGGADLVGDPPKKIITRPDPPKNQNLLSFGPLQNENF